MTTELFEVRVKGKAVRVPSVAIDDKRIVVPGKWIRIATIHDEDWMEKEPVGNPELFIAQLKEKGLKADVLTFAQRLPDTKPRYKYPVEWDNVAAIPVVTFAEWWEQRLPQASRKSVRRASKRGVIVRPVTFDDALVQQIVELFNETLIKQRIPFAHHGKDFDAVKKELSTMLDRSEFIGAYYGNELIGYIKLVYMGKLASILNILSKDRHYDKRPTNALVAKAVEICEQRKMSYLLYGKYTYGNKANSSLAEFKRRNGFEEIRFPRYYVPLTLKGKIIMSLKLHRGLLGILPARVISVLLKLRSRRFQGVPRVLGVAGVSGGQVEEDTKDPVGDGA